MLLTEYNEIEVQELFKEEGRKEGRIEGKEEGRKEGRKEGMLEFATKMVKDKLLTITQAAKQLNLSEDDFIKCMKEKA